MSVRFYIIGLALGLLVSTQAAHAAIIATPPGKTVSVVEEKVFIVFDPLTGVQSSIVRHGFEETAFAFGLLIPVPGPTKVQQHSSRLRRVIERRLHPQGKTRRALDIDFVSWLASCAVPMVGDPVTDDGGEAKSGSARAQHLSLGNAPEPLHDWLLSNGFTLSPAQTAWIEELRGQGWSFIGFILRPPAGEHRVGTLLYGPVISLTHPATEPLYAAYEPPFALFDEAERSTSTVEISVLSEWSVVPLGESPPAPFYADTFPLKQLIRLRNQAGRVPWSFRRDGTLTGYELPRSAADGGILRFRRTTPFPPRRPAALSKERAYVIEVPLEGLALLAIGLLTGLGRLRRRSGRKSSLLG